MGSKNFADFINGAAEDLNENRSIVIRIEFDSASIEGEGPDGEVYPADEMGIDVSDTSFDDQLAEAVRFLNSLDW